MIVVDASALLAILEGEPDAAKYAEALADADAPLISATTLIAAGIEVANVTPRHARIAIDAFETASFTRWQKPQVCRSCLKGNDFSHTDVPSVL